MSGKLCLGRIKNIEPYHLNISLLHGVKGRVNITEINVSYHEALEQLLNGDKNVNVKMMSEMFEVGQIVRCSPQPGETITDVTMKSKTKPVGLSLSPSRINGSLKKSLLKPYVTFVGAVKSVEDNGYIIDTGINGVDVFLPYEETPLSVSEKYSIGCLVELAIMDDQSLGRKSRVLRASMLKRQNVPDSDDVSFDSLLPGMRIPVKVISSGLEGLECTFRSFLVHIPAQHCPQEVKKYCPDNQFYACIVDIDLATKAITASILPHFIKDDLKESEGLMAYKYVKVGAFVENAVLKRRERNCVYLWLPSFNRCGVLLKSNAYGKDAPKKWTSHFPENTEIKCRIIDFDLFINAPMISIRKKILESRFLTLEDVKVGSKITVTIKKFLPRGVSVRYGESIRGVIPYLHLSDVSIKNPEERFKITSKIQAMVLGIDHEKGELQLTARKSLISSSFPILGSANMLQSWTEIAAKNTTNGQSTPESLIVTAYVIQSGEKGVLVCGVNNVRGWIPQSQTVMNEMQASKTGPTKGEILQLRVLKRLQVSPQRSQKPSTQFLLSQILDPENARPVSKSHTSAVKLGEFYFCRVDEVKVRGLQVNLLKTAESKNVVASAFLPYVHLSDSISITDSVQVFRNSCFQPNSILSLTEDGNTPARVVVVTISGKEGVVVSAKPSLLEAAQTSDDSSKAGFLRSVDQLQVGTQWIGWVAHHMNYGTFVELPGGCRGLVPTRYLCDLKAPEETNWVALLPPGTSVEAKVVEVNGPRLLLSLRMTDTYSSAEEQYVRCAVARAEQYLKECRWICKHVGQIVKFHVEGLTDEVVTGWVALPSSGNSEPQRVPAAALLLNTAGVECPLGSIHEAVVTLPNPDAGKLEVSILPWLLSSVKQRRGGQYDSSAMQVRNGQIISSSVVSMGNTRDVVVVALKQHAIGNLAVVPTRRSFNDIIDSNKWTLGQINRITIRGATPFVSNREKIFFGTLSIYDPLVSKTKEADTHAHALSPSTVESLTTPGNHLPEVVFIRLNGRANALFRLPNTRGDRSLYTRLICRLVDLKPSSGKEIRKFLAEVPDAGTVFRNAVVINAPTPSTRGTRLPLSSKIARISFNEKEPQVGDLVSAMFLGIHGLSWRLLLPNNTQGFLHVSCMSKSSQFVKGEELAHPPFPTHPGKSIWLTCRIIDQVTNVSEHEADDDVDLDKSMEVFDQEQTDDTPQISRGDEVIPIGGDEEDEDPRMPNKLFYVSTDASDIRKWNPEKYSKELELTLSQPVMGIIKRRFRRTLIVSLNYKTDVVIRYSTPLKPDQKVGAPIKIILTSLEPLEGRLAEPLFRRKRSISCSTAPPSSELEGPSPKRRKRNNSVHLPEKKPLPNITDMLARYADVLPLLRAVKKAEEERKKMKKTEVIRSPQVEDRDVLDVEMTDVPVKDKHPSTHSTVAKNEARLAQIAKATSCVGQDTKAKIPRISTAEEFEVAVRNAPQNPRLWSLYAAHYQAAGDFDRARGILRRALDSPIATNLGSEEFVGDILLASLRLESSAAPAPGVAQINEKGKRNLEEVIRRIEQIDKGALISKTLSLLSRLGLHEQADTLAKKFVKKHSLVPGAWLNLVRARFMAGNIVGARESQRNAGQTLNMSQIPQFAVECARLEYKFGDFDRAVKLMEEQISAHPQRKWLYTNYIRLLLQAAKRKEAEAVRHRALKKLPEKEHALINRLFKS